ncbi:hypothetical protein CR513_30681, partial [Mucuna pruriens]
MTKAIHAVPHHVANSQDRSHQAIKGSTLAEHLAYHLVIDHQPLLYELLDEYMMTTMSIEP